MGKPYGEAILMESFFNELSLREAKLDHQKTITGVIDTCNELKKYTFSKCRIDSSSSHSLLRMFSRFGKNGIGLFYSMFCQPFDNGNEPIDNEYLMHNWKIGEDECQGLAYAFLNDSISISLSNEPWLQDMIEVRKDSTPVSVRNSFSSDISFHREWLESFTPINLVTTDIEPSKKQISIRDDHGKDVLLKFSKQICSSPYVVKVINSMPFNSNLTRFIRRTYSDGRIELVLNWTELGFGIIVQTTGRNKRETDRIGEILKAKYSK